MLKQSYSITVIFNDYTKKHFLRRCKPYKLNEKIEKLKTKYGNDNINMILV